MAGYDKIAKHFFERRADKTRFDYNRDIEVPAMIKMVGNVKNKIILDLGCGFGDHSKKLSQKGAQKIIAFDLSKELVKFANNQKIPNCKFEVGDMDRKLKYKNNYFDLVISGLALHYVKNVNQLFSEVNRVLKKGGMFIISTGHPIFDLINESLDNSSEAKIAIKRVGNKRIIEGDYFDESKKLADLGSIGKIKTYSYTFETFLKLGLNNGFELIDYLDAKPVPSSKKYDSEKYKLTTTLPTFILFKWKKK
ncbi:class I SAM-dependent methyltransferase [Candidatus Woesearchaeota archaeon]|jgi:ubiquinone/menaquinone biosynthesis C-methylase UbiE|nr:class I SAM-dependent methyltransferase [Candidatus Woesearchaeota archaeon]MBT5343216.1 class I SAM-dependent methyltransferase [Candidatus Woesearchaeota archaeon]